MCWLTGRMVPEPLSGYLGGWGEPWAGPEQRRGVSDYHHYLLPSKTKYNSDIKYTQTRKSYSERGFCAAQVAACGVHCDRKVVGQWERLWRCRDWTEGRTWWASEAGCCGGVLAGRGCEGSGRTGPKGRGRPGKQQAEPFTQRPGKTLQNNMFHLMLDC